MSQAVRFLEGLYASGQTWENVKRTMEHMKNDEGDPMDMDEVQSQWDIISKKRKMIDGNK